MGVDGLLADPTFPRSTPLSRLIDPGMVAAMVESVVAHVLDYHRHHYVYRTQKAAKKWYRLPQYMASDRTIGILGLGELGTAVAGNNYCHLASRWQAGSGVQGKILPSTFFPGRPAWAKCSRAARWS